MEAHVNLIILICLSVSISVGSSQEAPTSEPASAARVKGPSFPYVAEITADDVYFRSGAGTNYYPCGKLNKGDRVTVVGSQFGWSRIVPPAGSFSWISTQYVDVDRRNPASGTVRGNAVRVYVGSEFVDLIRSTTVDLKLDKGEKVKLTGEQNSGYHKIAPPSGSYRWISTKYTQPVRPMEERPERPPQPPVPPPATSRLPSPAVPPTAVRKPLVPAKIPDEASRLEQYHALEQQLKAERSKPIPQQNYAEMKRELVEIAGDERSGKARRYAEFALKQVGRFELALEVEKARRLQDVQLEQTKERIARARAKRLEEFKGLGRFVVIGRFQFFTTYGPGHYRVVDDSGKTLCYALPSAALSHKTLNNLIGKKVGLVGTIEPHRQTAGALVRFTQIAELD
ncbi:MAG: SH3 domain-containing protein [Planctomycetota bacterium]